MTLFLIYSPVGQFESFNIMTLFVFFHSFLELQHLKGSFACIPYLVLRFNKAVGRYRYGQPQFLPSNTGFTLKLDLSAILDIYVEQNIFGDGD
ncbi:hypothetical protein Lal_00049488 [Lupinus albus]|nr:hypothetical protein Lal_00049488 [Lupinus albus]